MAGLLRRKIPDAPDAQMVLTDIISEAKMANAIVQEVLDFVRPIRLQVDHTAVADAVQGAIQLADSKGKRGNVDVNVAISDGLPHINADQHQITQVFTNLLMNAYEAMGGKGRVTISADCSGSKTAATAVTRCSSNSPITDRGFRPTWRTRYSTRSSRRRPRAPVSAWPSCGRSWTRMTDGLTCGRPQVRARRFG